MPSPRRHRNLCCGASPIKITLDQHHCEPVHVWSGLPSSPTSSTRKPTLTRSVSEPTHQWVAESRLRSLPEPPNTFVRPRTAPQKPKAPTFTNPAMRRLAGRHGLTRNHSAPTLHDKVLSEVLSNFKEEQETARRQRKEQKLQMSSTSPCLKLDLSRFFSSSEQARPQTAPSRRTKQKMRRSQSAVVKPTRASHYFRNAPRCSVEFERQGRRAKPASRYEVSIYDSLPEPIRDHKVQGVIGRVVGPQLDFDDWKVDPNPERYSFTKQGLEKQKLPRRPILPPQPYAQQPIRPDKTRPAGKCGLAELMWSPRKIRRVKKSMGASPDKIQDHKARMTIKTGRLQASADPTKDLSHHDVLTNLEQIYRKTLVVSSVRIPKHSSKN